MPAGRTRLSAEIARSRAGCGMSVSKTPKTFFHPSTLLGPAFSERDEPRRLDTVMATKPTISDVAASPSLFDDAGRPGFHVRSGAANVRTVQQFGC